MTTPVSCSAQQAAAGVTSVLGRPGTEATLPHLQLHSGGQAACALRSRKLGMTAAHAASGTGPGTKVSADLWCESGQCPWPAQGDPHLCGVLCSEPTALIWPCLTSALITIPLRLQASPGGSAAHGGTNSSSSPKVCAALLGGQACPGDLRATGPGHRSPRSPGVARASWC